MSTCRCAACRRRQLRLRPPRREGQPRGRGRPSPSASQPRFIERQGDPGHVTDPTAYLQALLVVRLHSLPVSAQQGCREAQVVQATARACRRLPRGRARSLPLPRRARGRVGSAALGMALRPQRWAAAIAAAEVAPHLPGAGEAGFHQLDRLLFLALLVREVARAVEHLRACLRRLVRGSVERALEPAAGLGDVAVHVPEQPQSGCEPRSELGLFVIEEPVEASSGDCRGRPRDVPARRAARLLSGMARPSRPLQGSRRRDDVPTSSASPEASRRSRASSPIVSSIQKRLPALRTRLLSTSDCSVSISAPAISSAASKCCPP